MVNNLQSKPKIIKDKFTSIQDNTINQSSTSNNIDKQNLKKNLTKKSKDTITYCMTMFDDYITTCSDKFIFLLRMLICFTDVFNLIVGYVIVSITMLQFHVYITLYQYFVISYVPIKLNEHVDIDINILQYP